MAASKEIDKADDTTAGNTAVPQHGDHDRVTMLSLNADGTPDQHRPEIIGDKDAAAAATREQFAQQAVSAYDQQLNDYANAEAAAAAEPDAATAELTAAHEETAEAAKAAADQVVDSLHRG